MTSVSRGAPSRREGRASTARRARRRRSPVWLFGHCLCCPSRRTRSARCPTDVGLVWTLSALSAMGKPRDEVDGVSRPPARHRRDMESDAGRDPPPRRPGSSRPPRRRPGDAKKRAASIVFGGCFGRLSAARRSRRRRLALGGGAAPPPVVAEGAGLLAPSSRSAVASCDACTLWRRARDGCDGGSSGCFSAGDGSSTRCSRARS